ncbi:phage tail protein [Acetobacter sp. KSO5]|uniref:phage tail protein n=1 Tax=Acetobacter sp. KSO5 TaxID=3373674 RepID=UPI00376F3F41
MAGQDQVEQLEVIVTTRDETAEGAASALRNLDAVEARGVSLTDVMSGMGEASGTATKTLAEGAAGAVTSFDDLGTRAAARVSELTKELTHLSGMQDTLRAQSQQALSAGVDASGATKGLAQVDAEISRVAGELEEVQTRLRAAAVSENAWNGALGERNAILNGLRAALDSQTEAQTKTNAATAAGIAQTQEQGSALSDAARSWKSMDEAAGAASQTVTEGATGALDSLEALGSRGSASITDLTAELSRLSALQESLRDQAQKAVSEGLDTSALREDLAQIDAQIQRTSADLTEEQNRVRQLKAAQDTLSPSQASGSDTAAVSSPAAVSAPSVSAGGQQSQDMQEELAAIKNAAGLTAGEMVELERAEAAAFTGLQAGADRSATSMLRTARSSSQLARTLLQLASAEDRLDDLKAQADAVPDTQMDSTVKSAILQDAEQRVQALQKQRDALLEAAQANNTLTESENKGGNLAKLESYQIGQIADEAHKFFDMVLAGGNPLQALFYEAPNAVQIMGGLGPSIQRITGLLYGPVGLAAAAAGAGLALYKMGAYAESEESKLAKLSQQLRATRSDAADMAGTVTSASKELGSQPGWSDDTARTAATSIGSTYNFTGTSTDIQSIAGMARDIGAVFGSLEDGLKAVNTAMEDPKAEIEALYKQHLPGVDLALVEQVKNLQAAGKQGEAYALVMGALTAATKGAYEQGLTPLQQAMENLKKSADPVIDKIKDFSEALGTTLLNTVTTYLNMAQGKTTDADWHYAPGTAPASASGDVSGTSLTVNKAHPEMVGLMQINTDYKSKYDPTTLDGNIDEGLYRLNNFAQQMNGDLNSAAALYNGAKPGSAAAQSYLNLVGKQSLSNLSPVVSGHFDTEGQKLGYSQGLVNFAKLISLAESSGKQWQDQTYSNVKPTSGSAADDHAKSAAVIDDQRSLTGGAADAAGSYSASSWTESRKGIEAYIESQQKLEDSQKKAGEDWTVTAEHITTARIALANTLSPQQQITQGLKDQGASLNSQTGYWRSMAEVVAQFGTEARGTGVDQTALSEALRAKQQQLAAAYNDGTVAVQRQAQAQQAIASVAGESAQDIQHATNYQQAYNEALEDFDPNSQQFADAVKKRTTALNSLSDAQQKAQQVQQNAALKDNLSLIQAETNSIGMNSDARKVMLAQMQAELEKHRQYGAVLPPEAQEYVDLTTQIAQASAEYERQQQVLQDVTGSLSGMADELSSDITQGFVQGTSSGMSFKSMLKGVETQIASLLVKFALINPMLNSIDGGTRTTLTDVTNLLSSSGSSGSSSLGVLGSLSGLSVGQQQAYRNEVTQSAMPSSGWAPTGDVMSLAGVKQASALDNLFSGKAADGSGIFSSLGSAVGTIGSYAGIAGAAVGIGTMIYNAFKGLFAKSHYAYTDVIATNGQLATGGTRVKRATNDVTAGLVQDITTVNDVLGAAGITVDDGSFGAVGHYKKGSKTSQTTLEDLLPDMKLNSSDPTLNMALQQLMPTSFDSVSTYTQDIESLKTLADTLDGMKVSVNRFDDASHVTIDHFNGYTGDMATALSTLDGKTLSTDDLQSKFEAIQEFFGTTMPGLMNVTTAGSESLLQQVADLKQKYQDAANTAASYGVDAQNLLDKGNAIAAMMIANENTKLEQSDQSVTARYMAATGDQQGADLLNQQVSSAQAIQSLQEEWQSYLGDNYADNVTYQQQLSNLEKTQAAERLQIQQSYAEKAAEATSQANQSLASTFSSLTEYAKGLSTSDASPLSVADQYKAANDNLQGDYQAALGGNSTALGSVQSDMQTFLSLSKTLNGGGIGYTTDYQQIVTMLQALGNLGTGDLTADAMRKIAEDQTATLAGNQQLLLAAVRQLLSEIRFQNSKAAA